MERVSAQWRDMERTLVAKKARLEAEAKRIANDIKKQKQQNLNKIFKNNKTILARLRRLGGRVSR